MNRTKSVLLLMLALPFLTGFFRGGSNAAEQAALQNEVAIDGISAVIPTSGGGGLLLSFDMVLEMRYLPEEELDGAPRPTPAQMVLFRYAVMQLEPRIREHMDTFLAGQSPVNMMGARGMELVRAEVMRFVNGELEKLDFEALKIPADISKKRITYVRLPSWSI